jgi:hypothetical protein
MHCSLGISIFLALSCLPLHAQEQTNSPRRWLEFGQGIVCDTPEQVERFVGLREDGRDAVDALQTINNESPGSTACDVALVAYTDSKPITARVIQGKLASVVQIMVHAVGNGATWRTITAHARYTIEVEEGQII